MPKERPSGDQQKSAQKRSEKTGALPKKLSKRPSFTIFGTPEIQGLKVDSYVDLLFGNFFGANVLRS